MNIANLGTDAALLHGAVDGGKPAHGHSSPANRALDGTTHGRGQTTAEDALYNLGLQRG